MGTLFITEYAGLAPLPPGAVGQIPLEPPLAKQTIEIGAASVASAAFNAATRMVRLHTEAACCVLFGMDPTAAPDDQRVPANQTQFHGVVAGHAFKVAVIST
jgi:hypothetical protein